MLLTFFVFLSGLSFSQTIKPSGASVTLFFEKVYLFTDRDHYTPGDDIWYSSFLVNAQTNVLTESSSNLYVELISPASKIIDRKMIRLDKGLGRGDFKLGDSIPSGTYRLRAYTNWMRNFGDKFLFEKNLTVYSPDETVSKAVSSAKSDRINFFPEGGSMVEGVSGIIAFKAESNRGKGLGATGNIQAEDGTVITALNTSFNGMGRFLLQPEPGKKYRAVGTYSSGKSFNIELPSALVAGYGLYVRQGDSIFTVTIKTNEKTYASLAKKEVAVVIKNKGKLVSTLVLPLSAVQSSFQIPKQGLPPGISSITVYDSAGRPNCERLIFIEGTERVILDLTSNKAAYTAKEKAAVRIKALDEKGQPVKARLSLSVVDAGLIPEDTQGNIVTYLHLQSELKGDIENAAQYFDPKNESRRSQLDLLLLSSGWRDFLWKQLADENLRIAYNPEKGVSVTGRVETKFSAKPVPNSNITLTASGARGNKLFVTQTDESGKFYVDGINLYGYQPVKITSVNSKAVKQGIVFVDTVSVGLLPSIKPLEIESEALLGSDRVAEIDRRKNLLKRQSLSDTLQLNEVVIKSQKKSLILRDMILTDFGYKEEEFVINPSDHDYTDLRHFLTHRLNYNSAVVSDNIRTNRDSGTTEMKPTYPRLIVNNREMPYTDQDAPELIKDYIDVYFGLRMSDVKYVKVKRMVGIDTYSGGSKEVYVVYINVNMNAIGGSEVGVLTRDVQGYYDARVFYEPNYTTPSTRPDVRSTIHWQPLINTNHLGEAAISYFNADPKSKIKVIAEGISDKGVPFSGILNYEVR